MGSWGTGPRLTAVAAVALAVCGCDGSGERELVVDLQTDYVPGVEVDTARTVVVADEGDIVRETPLPAEASLGEPYRIAELSAVPEDVRFRVELLDAGARVASRSVQARIDGRRQRVLVAMTRNCAEVLCPRASDPEATECLGGRCVPPECIEDTPELCGLAGCESGDDCAAAAGCVTPTCSSSGVCLLAPGDCGEGQYCSPERGCVPLPGETDAGPVDAGPMDAGPSDAGDAGGPACAPFPAPVELSLGLFAACARTAGQRYCWGRGSEGAIGHGEFAGVFEAPFRPDDYDDWRSLGIGRCHGCGVRADGTLWCWGDDWAEQLGIGPGDTARSQPVQVGSGSDWRAVAATRATSCALDGGGAVHCWGDNKWGKTGTGSVGGYQDVPGPVEDGGEWMQVDVSSDHACAIRADGTLWCWGGDHSLMSGGGGDSATPQQVGSDGDWQLVSPGWEFTAALRTDGSLWTWGDNFAGQLGLGEVDASGMPRRVGDTSDWVQVAGKRRHACGVRGDGSLWCWGENDDGELGIGTTSELERVPQRVPGSDWISVQAETSYTCAVKSDNTVWCWGRNVDGRLGTGDTMDRLEPAQVCWPG